LSHGHDRIVKSLLGTALFIGGVIVFTFTPPLAEYADELRILGIAAAGGGIGIMLLMSRLK
jgi:hypothetical protein